MATGRPVGELAVVVVAMPAAAVVVATARATEVAV